MSRKNSRLFAAVAAALGAASITSPCTQPAEGAPITPGDVVIYRVGNGAAALANTGNPVFIDEYNPGGQLVQSIPLLTLANGGNQALFASGTATSEGLLALSPDGRYVTFTGYSGTGTTSIVSSTSASNPRVVGRLDTLTGSVDTTTALTDFASANNPRGAFTADGTTLYVTGAAGGLRTATLGGTSSAQINTGTNPIANLRAVAGFGGNLFITTSSGSAVRIGQVGSGFPTTAGQDTTPLPGIPTATGSPYEFFFADLDGSPGIDTLYLPEDTTAGGSIQKFVLSGGSWALKGSATASGIRGLTGAVDATTGVVTLYGTTGGSGSNGGGTLYAFTDNTGFGGTISGSATALVTLAATSEESFRGITIVPEPASAAGLIFLTTGAAMVLRRRGKTSGRSL
jgi:hypothetical protein